MSLERVTETVLIGSLTASPPHLTRRIEASYWGIQDGIDNTMDPLGPTPIDEYDRLGIANDLASRLFDALPYIHATQNRCNGDPGNKTVKHLDKISLGDGMEIVFREDLFVLDAQRWQEAQEYLRSEDAESVLDFGNLTTVDIEDDHFYLTAGMGEAPVPRIAAYQQSWMAVSRTMGGTAVAGLSSSHMLELFTTKPEESFRMVRSSGPIEKELFVDKIIGAVFQPNQVLLQVSAQTRDDLPEVNTTYEQVRERNVLYTRVLDVISIDV